MITDQLTAFKEFLSDKPYCSNNLEYGLQIRNKDVAVSRRYIQHNKPTSVKYLTFDIDYPGVAERIGDNQLPPPNLIAYNKSSGRSHVFYALASEVYTVERARRKPIELLAAIEQQLCLELEADQAYTGLICKNPLHAAWEVHEVRKQPWDLNEFLEYLNLPATRKKKAVTYGLGRNVFLFDTTRFWAYAQVLSFRMVGKREEFFQAVLNFAEQKNQEFPTPLSFSEVQATAKSISKWTWAKYTGRLSDEQFSAVQSSRGKQSGHKRLFKSLDSRVFANLYSLMGLSQRRISVILNSPQKTVCNWLSD